MNRPESKIKIESYGCSTAAGPSTEDFWNGLCEGRDHSQPEAMGTRTCKWKTSGESAGADLLRELLTSWNEARAKIPEGSHKLLDKKLGVILASTKGLTDDLVWTGSPYNRDPLTPVLDAFIEAAGLRPQARICVSNACASGLGALSLAKHWIESGRVASVVIVAADTIGPFVSRGFLALKTLTPDRTRPFDRRRQGFCLGDAAAAIFVTGETSYGPGFHVEGVELDSEGFAVTRPSAGGESLRRACRNLSGPLPDLIVAHGTATIANDETEDRVFSELYGVPVTSTKWSVGHTLGASGAVDLIAACEILRRQKAFTLGNSTEPDPLLKGKYLFSGPPQPFNGERILVSSLGFGGTHAVAKLTRPE